MSKIQCLVRFSLPGIATIETFTEDDEEVILILDAEIAANLAMQQFVSDGCIPKRIHDVRREIYHRRVLHIPMVHLPEHGEPLEFSDGRHRSLTMHGMGFSCLPVLASRRDAEKLSHLYGEIALAKEEYDFPDDDVTEFIGRA
ncbi:hypothetical protein [Pseudomonas sp. JQ36]